MTTTMIMGLLIYPETEDAATASTSSAEQDFINLLNQFSNRISIYES